MTGLRDRKKQLTRESLLRAALELFTSQGYGATTVDEIAGAVEVSQRTFFRYFASKEDVAFAVVDLVESTFVDALRARPAGEGPFEAMRNAVATAWESMADTIESAVPMELYMASFRMVESTPELLAAHLRRSAELEETVARLIAERQGLDLDTDVRPRVAVAAFTGVVRATSRIWGRGEECTLAELGRLTVACLEQLTPRLLTDDWR
ncbi:TetR family transcriptional regulator [Streptomyces sp. NPDC093085]|uniref:TetR/AcrR family transcriptional regulator n=1 Tax=Streptomyces sp. NPDC093085 TaxID=3155068 RepID=UPI0034176933